MRMRKLKHGESRLLECREFLADDTVISDDDTVWLEIGAGKGGFACQMAHRNPHVKYFAMERISDCVTLAVERAKKFSQSEGNISNLKFLIETADNLSLLFAPGAIDRIMLNFSDPWSKKGYAKRRLTHRRYLALYLKLLHDGGKIVFKTDNDGLFAFTLEELATMGITPDIVCYNLHSSEYNKDNIQTEYEESFASQGIKIKMLEVVKRPEYTFEIPEDLTKDARIQAINAAKERRRSKTDS